MKYKTRHGLYWALHVIVFMIGVALMKSDSQKLVSVGESLIAAGIAGFVIFWYVLETERVSSLLEALHDFGLRKIFASRGVSIRPEYDAAFAKVSDSMDVLGFGLRSLIEDYEGSFESWAARAKIRVLIIDPEFPSSRSSLAEQRDREENNQKGDIGRDVREFIRRTAGLIAKGDGRFQVRLYKCLPSGNIFRIDDTLFWGPYLIGSQSRNMPTFVVKKGGVLYDVFATQFEAIWSRDEFSRAVPPEWLK
jgi:hypothetical protein